VLDELGPEVKTHILREFVARSSADLLTLALVPSDHIGADLKFLAHRVRGTSLLIGAPELAQACHRVETASTSDAEAITALRDALVAAVGAVEREIHAHP